jgi:hypothetical protein
VSAATDAHEATEHLEAVFSLPSVLKLYSYPAFGCAIFQSFGMMQKL